MDHTTNYRDTFITVSPDCPAMEGTVPPKPGTVAALQHERLLASPYTMTSDDLLFGVFADRNAIAEKDRAAARSAFFSKGQPCMRSSPLVKTYGWGVHHDAKERVAIYPLGSPQYDALAEGKAKSVVAGMRSKRA
jgi:hypothetical protein